MPTSKNRPGDQAQPAAAGARDAAGRGGVRRHGRNGRLFHPAGTPRRRQPRRRAPRLHRVGQLHLRLEEASSSDWGTGRWPGGSGATSVRRERSSTAIDTLVRRLYDEDGRSVQLVGWSLGGIFARHVAVRRPEMVRRVITLGSPYRITADGRTWPQAGCTTCTPRSRRGASGVRTWRCGLAAPYGARRPRSTRRATASSPGPAAPSRRPVLAENVGIHGSHNGLAHNPLAMYVVADRLALPPGELPRFEPPRAVRPFFDVGHG